MMKNKKIYELKNSVTNIDLFICSASFEERCLTLIKNVDLSSIKNILIIVNKDEEYSFNDNISKFPSDNILRISFSDSHDVIEKFSSYFANYFKTKCSNVFVDITTFTHEGLLIVLKMLQLYKYSYKNLTLGYVGAKEYSVNETSEEQKWLSKGIKSIRSVIGYPGILEPSKPNHLIIPFGFELERTINLIEELDYKKISLGFGSEHDSINTKHYKLNKVRHEELMSHYKDADKFEISLRDPLKTKTLLVDFLQKYSDYNNIIVPMSNKISTLGVALYAMEHPKVQLCYIKPKEYNTSNYSIPSEDCYLFDIELPNLKETL